MISARRMQAEDIPWLTGGIMQDEDFDFRRFSYQPKANEVVIGHFDGKEPFGLSILTLVAPDIIQIDVTWNRPVCREMGMGRALIAPFCDLLGDLIAPRGAAAIRAEAVSSAGMRFCKSIAYELALRGIARDVEIKDRIDYPAGAAEHGDFRLDFAEYPGLEPRRIAVFLFEQAHRDIWKRDYPSRGVRHALARVTAAILGGDPADEIDMGEISGRALLDAMRNPREAEFCMAMMGLIYEKEREFLI